MQWWLEKSLNYLSYVTLLHQLKALLGLYSDRHYVELAQNDLYWPSMPEGAGGRKQ